MPTHIITSGLTESGATLSGTVSIDVEGADKVEVPVANATTNKQIDLAIVLTRLKTLAILVDVDMTLKTNSTGSPDDTLALKANNPLVWNSLSGQDCPITADVTTAYATNAGSTAGTIKIWQGRDASP